jgi:hypothetical protein
LFPLFAIDVVDIRGKFTAAVVEIGGNLPLVLLTPAASLPWHQQYQGYWRQNLALMPLILVVHLDLRISPRIF